ncbi:MAG TPA: hypothetical protein VKV05_06475 [Terriglobales bacterium]|nr:hypothetical protein [Terriglobales bacterium]
MASYRMIVLSNPVAGKDAEFNEWYDHQHIPDLLNIPGFAAAQRFKLAETQLRDGAKPYRYLAVWEIETDDLAGVFHELSARRGTPEVVASDAIDSANVQSYVFMPVTPRVTAPEVARPRKAGRGKN